MPTLPRATAPLLLFHYFEGIPAYQENLVHLICLTDLDRYRVVVVSAGPTTLKLPDHPHITLLETQNLNLDFGGYCHALEKLSEKVLDAPYVVFVNSSVRGPFMEQAADGDWPETFARALTDGAGLVGATMCLPPASSALVKRAKELHPEWTHFAHVQTTAYALSRSVLKRLMDIGFFRPMAAMGKEDLIIHYEFGLTRVAISVGARVRCLLPGYPELTNQNEPTDPNKTSNNGDPQYPGAYFGRTARPNELIFVKSQRHVVSELALRRLTLRNIELKSVRSSLDWTERHHLIQRLHGSLCAAARADLRYSWTRFKRSIRARLRNRE